MTRPAGGGNGDGCRRGTEVRGGVAVLLSRFPTVTETFILREIRELERQGQPVRLVPLLRDDPPVVHDEARRWTGRALFTPFLSREIVAANLRVLRDDPAAYLSVLRALVTGMAASPGFLVRSLALFPKIVYLARRLESEGIRHVHAHFATHPATAAWAMSRLADLSYSVTVHAHDIFVDRTFLAEKLQGARFVRVISEYNRRYLLSRLPGLDGDRVRVVHAGVDVDEYRSEPDRRSGLDVGPSEGAEGSAGRSRESRPLIVTVASLEPYKGLPVLLEACRILGDQGVAFRCVVAGDGPAREQLETRAAELGLEGRLRFLGAIPEGSVPELLERASVFVLPSVVQRDGQMDGIPVALMEAMAAGLPVVASDLSGIPELVEDGRTGLLRPPGGAAGVADAVRHLLQHPERARAMGERAREKVRDDFSLEECVSRLMALLGEHVGYASEDVRDRIRDCGALSERASRVGLRRVRTGRESWSAELVLGENGTAGDRSHASPRAVSGEWPREVVLKIHRSGADASRSAQRRARMEYDVLRSLAGREKWALAPASGDGPATGQARTRAGDPLGAPVPLHLDEAAGTVVMTRCGEASLRDLIAGPGGRRWQTGGAGGLHGLFGRSGAWLRAFQKRDRTPGRSRDLVDDIVRRAREDVGCLPEGLLGAGEARALRDRLDELRRTADAEVSPALRHGDFRPGNVRVGDDGRVAVVGFERTDRGYPPEDPARFLASLSLSLGFPGPRGRRERLAKAFLEGYGSPSLRGTPGYELCLRAVAARLLRRVAGASERRAPGHWIRRKRLLSMLRGKPV